MNWELRVLGPLELLRDGQSVPLDGAAGWILGRLAVEPGRLVALPDLMNALWGEDLPSGPAKVIQSYVSQLRAVTGPDLVVTKRPGYLLAIEPDVVDAVRFAEMVANGRTAAEAGAHVAAVGRLDLAEQQWRGEAFSDLPDLPYVRQERTRLRDLRVTARELAVGARLAGGEASGDSQPIVAELEALLSVHPLREQLWAYLVQAHYRAGRQAEALAAYQRARSVLISELGMEPGPLLRDAELAVLRQAPPEPQTPPQPLPAELLTLNAMPLVGRDTILAALRGLLDEAAFGEPQGALLCGAPGSGKTRLLAEFARVAADRGAAIGWLRPGEHAGFFGDIDRYTVYLLDDADRLGDAYAAQLAKRWRELRGPVILVATAVEPVPLGLQQLDVPPLTAADVTAVVRQYVPHEAGEEVDRFAEGLETETFAVVHERAAAWAVERAVTQVGAGVATLTVPADQARQARAQLLAGISDLIRLRQARAGGLKPTNDCPYPGLGRFETDDAAYFHGRDRAIADLITRVAATEPGGVIAVVGPSGSGKSSLVRAGLLAALADGVLPGSADWRVQVHEPSRSTPDGPADLVVIDQFEEVFTVLGPAARARYTEKMAATARIVITLRSDYLATVSEDIVYGPMVAGNPVLMAQPSRAELADMVYGPAAAAGLEIEPGLVEDIVADLGAQRHLPLLCTALAGLWRARQGTTLTREALREQGGMASAVERLGESAYAAMDLEQQQAAHRMLVRLTDVDPESGPIRRPERRGDLLDVGAAGAPEALEILVTHRLVVADGERVEIAHEALLRHWPRLSDWLHADAAGRQLRQQMIDAADRWRLGGGEPADLYRGARLAAAREWAADHGDELTPAEHEFLATSITHAERGQRRLRLLTGVVAAGLVMAIVAGVVAAVQWRRADTQRDRADAAALSADTRRLSALALTERNLRLSMLEAVAAARLDPSTATSYGLLAALQRANALISVRGNESGDPQRAMTLSGDGSLLAVGSRNARVEVYTDRQLARAWNAEGLMPIHGMQFLNGDRELAVWSDQAVRLYDPRTGDPLGPVRPKPKGITAGVLPDGHTMVLAGLDEFPDGTQQSLRLWDMNTSRPARETAPAGRWTSVSSDQTLAGPGGIGIVENGRVRVLRDTPSTVAARSPAGRGRMAAATGATLTVWSTNSATSARRATAAGLITNLAYAADGQRIITAGDGWLSVWDVATLTPVMTATLPGGGISRVALAPDGKYAYASGADGGIYTWLVDDPLTGGQPLTVAQPLPAAGCDNPHSNVLPLAESLAIACDVVSFVDYESGAVTTTSLPAPPTAYAVGGGRLLAGLADGTVRELSPESRVLATAGVPVVSVAAHGDLLAYAGGGTVHLIQGGKPLLQISQQDDPQALAFSPDGRYLALGQYAQTQVLELPSGRLVATLSQAGAGWRGLLSFSGDGRRLLVGGQSGRVQLIDTTGWQRLWEASTGHAGFTVSAAFGGDGRSVITAGDDGRILVLDRETGAVLAGFGPGGHTPIAATVRGPDIVAVIDFTRLRSYHIDPAAWIERACVVAGRDMTAEEWAGLLPGRPRIAVCP